MKLPTRLETIDYKIFKKARSIRYKRQQNINEVFKPKNPLLLEPVPTWGYFSNLDYVIDKRKALDAQRTFVVLAIN